MGILRPNEGEVKLKRKMASEYFSLYGIDGTLYEIDTERHNLYGDDDNLYKIGKPIPMIFQQFPDIKTLKKLGWFNQELSQLPWIMYLPFYDADENETNIQENAKLAFSVEVPTLDVREFKVKKIASKGFSAMYWVANVVPIAEEIPPADPGDADGDSYTFLNG